MPDARAALPATPLPGRKPPRRQPRRRRLALTSLVDVIFLLLLFFMLSSTFTRFAELELTAAGTGPPPAADARPVFLQLAPEALRLNGQPQPMESVADALADTQGPVLIALRDGVTAQRLTDLLVRLSAAPTLDITVLGAP